MPVACANEKGIKQTSKMKATSVLQSIQNRCEHDAQQSDAKMMENCANMDTKREPQSRNICQKYINKSLLRYDTKTGHTSLPRWRIGVPSFNTDNTNRQYKTQKVNNR